MRILIIKMSSMGDIIHTLPAITDAAKAVTNVQFDWVAEESFKEIPLWSTQVHQVIPIGLRRWRKNLWYAVSRGEIKCFYKKLRAQRYDIILDAQASFKSAITTRLSRGYRLGMDKNSVRESLACFAYQKVFFVQRQQHAIFRIRQLFSKALGYPLVKEAPVDYGIDKNTLSFPQLDIPKDYLVCIPNTSCFTKRWTIKGWSLLIKRITAQGTTILIPWGTENEKQYTLCIANKNPRVYILPQLQLGEVAGILLNAQAIISVDTGLSHLTAALGVPAIVLYGPTDPLLIGTIGQNQRHIVIQPTKERRYEDEDLTIKKIEKALFQILARRNE